MSFRGKLMQAALLSGIGAGIACAQSMPAQGIPIDDQLTIQKCGGCHQRDANGMMRRLSYIRTSPEVWEQAIKRMIRLNGLSITPAEVRNVLTYLSSNNGLAPEEMKPGFWEVEHRTTGYQDDYVPNPALQKTCNNCHSIGRVLSQRRTRDDYEKLAAMHVGLFPGAANIYRPARGKAVADVDAPARPNITLAGGIAMEYPKATTPAANAKYPIDIALDYLATAQPLMTPEWTSWRAAMRPPKLAGTWLLSGYQPGKGKLYGQVLITPGAADNQFATSVQFTYVGTGASVKTSGKSVVYTGYNWRGHVAPPSGPATAPLITATVVPTEWREAMMVSRDGNSMDGRWFWSGFGELGIDVHLVRVGNDPLAIGTDISALQSPSKSTVKVYGANLAAVKAGDIDLGRGVTITKIVSATPGLLTAEVDVAKGLPVGMHDLAIGRNSVTEALAVYDKAAYIEVTPEANISRLGGLKYPKEYAQFEAIAYAAGPDGKAHTDDDVPLGMVPARWAMEEFLSTPDDDDTKFVGSLDDSGFFTPNVEGPNPARKKQANNFPANNYGDVWIAATYKTPEGTELKAKAYLVVTIPNYSLYDQPEVAP